MDFWKTDVAKQYNKDRVDAFSVLEYSDSIEKCISVIKNQEEVSPLIITTTALERTGQISFADLLNVVQERPQPILLLFGTGNGLIEEIHEKADYVLHSIKGCGKYNHLSVRSAVAIVLDRLTSEK